MHAVLVYPGHDGEPQQEPDEDADHERVHLQYSTVQYSTVQIMSAYTSCRIPLQVRWESRTAPPNIPARIGPISGDTERG